MAATVPGMMAQAYGATPLPGPPRLTTPPTDVTNTGTRSDGSRDGTGRGRRRPRYKESIDKTRRRE